MTQKIIYLDQKIWIELARVYLKIDLSTEKQELIKIIEDRVVTNELILPSYITHVAETFKIKDQERRLRLAGTIGYFCKDYFLKPYEDYEYFELQNLLRQKIGLDKNEIQFLTKCTDFFGLNILLRDLDPERRKYIENAFIGPMLWSKLAYLPEFCNAVISSNDEFDKGTMDDLKKLKNKYNEIKDNKLKYKVFLIENFKDFMYKYIKNLYRDLSIDKVSTYLVPKNEDEAIALMRSIPTLDVRMHLSYEYIAGRNSKWHINDATDIAFLTAAIPYADIVVTERKWCSVAKKYGLNNKYKTKMISSLLDLKELIND